MPRVRCGKKQACVVLPVSNAYYSSMQPTVFLVHTSYTVHWESAILELEKEDECLLYKDNRSIYM